MAKCIQCELLAKEIEQFQRKPYIVLKHEGKLYKAYELEEIQKASHQCVPWRGAGGDIGQCVYCGHKA